MASSFHNSGLYEDTVIARPEHPNPQFKREHWATLNGIWDFHLDLSVSGKDQKYTRIRNPTTLTRSFPCHSARKARKAASVSPISFLAAGIDAPLQ